jgi:tetratricopeptide (TPR) repeat protein
MSRVRLTRLLSVALLAGVARADLLSPELVAAAERGEVAAAMKAARAHPGGPAEARAAAAWVWWSQGQRRKALEVATRARTEGAAGALALWVQARVGLETGDYPSALGLARDLVSREPGVATQLLLGEVLHVTGAREEASEAFAAAIRAYNGLTDPSAFERLQGARAARFGKDPYGAVKHLGALVADHPDMASAYFEFGEVFRTHYQTGDALIEYRRGLEQRPDDGRMKASEAWMMWEDGPRSEAVEVAKAALALSPDEPRAWLVLAQAASAKRDWTAARHAAEKALERNPSDPRMLAHQVEVLLAADDEAAAEASRQRCLGVDPAYAELDRVLGDAAQDDRRIEDALEHYGRGLERDPRHTGCLLRRGSLLLREGMLSRAREDLERARFLDPFLVKAVNYLKILDRFEDFSHVPLETGVLALSPYGPSSAGPFFRDRLDRMIASLAKEHDHTLRESIRVEVFANQDWMNARAMGLGIEFGAGFSFGRCLTFFSGPSEAGRMGWWRTMRHEIAHTFHSDRADRGKVPAWFTEGLATFIEGPRGSFADGVLRAAHFAGELTPLEELVHWKYGGAKLYLHYLQGGVAMDWLRTRTGHQDWNRYLDLFAQGKDTEEVLGQVLGGGDMASWSAEYAAHLDRACQALRTDMVFSIPPLALQEAARGGDVEARAKLALILARKGQADKAAKLLEGLSGAEAGRAEAFVARARKAPDTAARLEAARADFPLDPALPRELGVWLLRQGDRAGAVQALEDALGVDPGDLKSAELLAGLYSGADQQDRRRRVLRELLATNPDHAWAAWELAKDAKARKRFDEARDLVRTALDVDAYHPDVFRELAALSARLGDTREARRAWAAYVGVRRVGVGPSRMGAPLPAPPEAAPSPSARPPADPVHWLPGVPLARREAQALDLLEELVGEEAPELALAGMADALGRELVEWGADAPLDVVPTLHLLMHGAHGPRPARAAAIALGWSRRGEAGGFLLAAREAGEEGPFGEGTAAAAATAALQALAVRPADRLSAWWEEAREGTSLGWLTTALQERGYPDAPAVADGEAKLMTVVLEDEAWYRAYAARLRLVDLVGSRAGRGGFHPQVSGHRPFEEVRALGRAAFRRVLKERQLARQR